MKPFVCRIFPFVPRVVEGRFWLYCVGECGAGSNLSSAYVANARALAAEFFADWTPTLYETYWNENKLGDFDDSRVIFRVPVYDN